MFESIPEIQTTKTKRERKKLMTAKGRSLRKVDTGMKIHGAANNMGAGSCSAGVVYAPAPNSWHVTDAQ